MSLYNIANDRAMALAPHKFGADHLEEKIQSWVDKNPAMINDGQPMLSLGCEITTSLGHNIDNLLLDGNGTILVCEAKRGKAPRDVISQLLDYAAYVDGLTWADLEKYCKKRHGKNLDDACQEIFRRTFTKTGKLCHRLMVLAESFDQQIMKQASYLMGVGTPLALMQFSYFRTEGAQILQMKTALGEIPEQMPPPETEAVVRDTQGVDNWLYASVGASLPDMAVRHGWDLRYKINKQSLPFHLADWHLPLGDCQIRIDSFRAGILSFRFYFRKQTLPGLEQHMQDNRHAWEKAFPAKLEEPPYETLFASFSYDMPFPQLGDNIAVKDVIDRVEAMATALIPVINGYFQQKTL
ncbi:MAG TPA: hypothetical protein VIF12_03475 [Micavibrio sp.]|jgi:hypothetical protein